jgi:hypothetical protein
MEKWSICLFLGYIAGRPAEFVDNEKKAPKDGSLEEVFGLPVNDDDDNDDIAPDEESRVLVNIISQAVIERGRCKALCYEDILLVVVQHPDIGKDVLVMAVKLVHHKGENRKPRP